MSTFAEKCRRVEDLRSQAEDILAQADALEAEIENSEARGGHSPAPHSDLDGVDRRRETPEPVYTRESWRARQEGRTA